jgi:hypothetical protein
MVLLAVVVCAIAATPGSLVWCRGESGHNALELVWVGCCAPTGPVEGSPTDGGRGRRAPGAAPSACTEGPCTDVLLSTAIALSPSPRAVAPPPAATSPFEILAGRSDSARSRDREFAVAGSRQVRDILRAAVLTI